MKIVLLRAIYLLTPGGWVGGVLGLIFAGNVSLASQSPYPIIVCSVANYLYFSFCPLSINYRTIHKENKIILSRRGAHLGRLTLSPLVKLSIMTAKKNRYSIDIIIRTIIDPILVTFGQIRNFRDPNLATFYLCIYLILNEEHFTFHLQYKHSCTFADRKCKELSYPKNQKMCDPILETLLKVRSHYNQSNRENATPSSGTSSLASYKEVPPGCYGVDRYVPIVPGSQSPILPSPVRPPYKTIQSDKVIHLYS